MASSIGVASLMDSARTVRAQTGAAARSRTIETSALTIGFEESGDPQGFPIVLLHGFPDDARAFDRVAPPLVKRWISRHRSLSSRFRSDAHPRPSRAHGRTGRHRSGRHRPDGCDRRQAVRGVRLRLGRSRRVHRRCPASRPCACGGVHQRLPDSGHDLRSATSTAGERAGDLVSGTTSTPNAAGSGSTANRRSLCRLLWETWSPTWKFTDEEYNKTAVSFDNPDFVDVVIHSYRHRIRNAPGEPRFEEMERVLAKRPPIDVPTIVLHPTDDGVTGRPSTNAAADKANFSQLVDRRIVEGAGHFMPREKPEAVSTALLDVLRATK